MLRGRATMSQCGTSVVPQLIDLLKLQPSMLQGTSAPPLLYEIQAKYAGCVGSGAHRESPPDPAPARTQPVSAQLPRTAHKRLDWGKTWINLQG